MTSTSANNPGRKFYTCFKKRGDPDKCTFFKWVDELPQSSQGAAVPSVSQTPSKRSRANTPSTSNFSPSKTVTKVSRNRFDPEDVDDIVNLASDEETIQFLRGRSPDEPPAKKYRFHRTEEMSGQNVTLGSSSETNYLPISSTKTPRQTSQWRVIRDDPENPFHVHAAPVNEARSSKSPLSQPLASSNTSVITGDSIKQARGFLSAIPEAYCKLERKLIAAEKARDAKASRIAKLDKEVEDRDGRIANLEKEIEDLKDRNRSLEEAMESLIARG